MNDIEAYHSNWKAINRLGLWITVELLWGSEILGQLKYTIVVVHVEWIPPWVYVHFAVSTEAYTSITQTAVGDLGVV